MSVYAYELWEAKRTTEAVDPYTGEVQPMISYVSCFRVFRRGDMERDVARCDDRDDAERIVAALNAMEQRV